MVDEYQKRYEDHQKYGKREDLIRLMQERHSNRMFHNEELSPNIIKIITETAKNAPSSCDRHGVRLRIVTDRDEKALLNGILVGGVGWIYRAPCVLLMVADPLAYKAGDEISYMPYLDAGFLGAHIQLTAQAMGLHSAFCNPNIRRNNISIFNERFMPTGWDSVLFCGAVAIGYPHPETPEKHRNLNFEMEKQ